MRWRLRRSDGMKVLIPSPLRPYTNAREVDADGRTVAEVLANLDARYPGIRFRMVDEQGKIRPHMRLFVNGTQEFDLARALNETDDIAIVQALSGGCGVRDTNGVEATR